MPHPETAPRIRLDLYQERSSAVTATITGTPTRTIHALLTLHGFEPLDEETMVMARIDREEPHYAEQAARALQAENITVNITPELRDEIDTEWTWANYPMPWCSREKIREVSNDAQKIYDDIRHGRLIIHAHAHNGWTTVAVSTYLNGPNIHLHGENLGSSRSVGVRRVRDPHTDDAARLGAWELAQRLNQWVDAAESSARSTPGGLERLLLSALGS
ncbi:hypothetical protein OG306_29340 [Streptomyces sp. NBC_01241]|uniref:hypothetical protein n=1 Tax=Streptomyces sp. NBC_01241 TaxID=2903794 RepID=UPI00352E994D|nr:hypothetical protein OG306_29340 [Streptomyces sp. NBC_01241]